MNDTPALERLLRRDRALAVVGIVLLCILAWVYILNGAGMGMGAGRMFSLTPLPHAPGGSTAGGPASGMSGMGMSDLAPTAPAWSGASFLLVVAMWWVMMIAMMAPSAAPTILLYARAYRHSVAQGQIDATLAPTGAFAVGYLLAWLAFSVAAASLQYLLARVGLLSDIGMDSRSHWLSGGLLIAAGAYQLSPLKGLCLEHCRSPTEFLTRHWRPGAAGAARLGVLHGAYCVGCCWTLMALLFVGGVMNLIWIAALSIVVLVEKLAPAGKILGRVLGVALVVWGGAVLLV